jgi:cell division protein FtsN
MLQAPALSSPSGVVPARILPRLPNPASPGTYRVQVGAFLDQRNAVDAYNRLAAAGFTPVYEKYNDYYRILLPGIRASEIENIARRLGAANFSEALIREER